MSLKEEVRALREKVEELSRPKPLLTTPECAELLSMSASRLFEWRRDGIGPPYMRFGATVRYDRAEVLAWFATQKVKK
ncbi:MAG: hypothetical protein DI533_14085 [Cereibacter sphaeroides]|uniref:Helix-turn-helix domain-containing protein n=1 Tax=Cereibacter sphaeroides TaxID=1063 RepID=A0A2W5S3T4_CERSP|nr:MAG: hypothetical protein DI533_14085 [Cereibacter sphaeroides]